MTIEDILQDGPNKLVSRKLWCENPNPAAAKNLLMQNRFAVGDGEIGAVATGSPHATRAGVEILKQGGNAADAAAGAAFAIMVVDPPNASPAGRGHILWSRKGELPRAIDGATKAPSLLALDQPNAPKIGAFPLPGIVRAVMRLHAEAGKLPLHVVAAYAQRLAQEGFPVPKELAHIWKWRNPDVLDDDARRHFFPEGEPVKAGLMFRHSGLALFFERLIETGKDPFEDEEFATSICNRLAKKGALWTPRDLIDAEPLDGEIVSFERDNWRLTSIGRQGWGHTLLRIVSLVTSVEQQSPLEAEIAHLLSILRAFEERPEEVRSLKPKEDSLSWDILSTRMREPLEKEWAQPVVLSNAIENVHPTEELDDRDTTHLSVIDADGMRVALTQSIGPHFGGRVADPETGILLAHSYRMAEAPLAGARDVTEQCPCLLDMDGWSYALGGAGSERIPGAVAAVIRHLLAGSDLDEALAAPRSNWVGATARIHVDAPLGLEDRLARAKAAFELTGRGPVDHLGIVQAVGQSNAGVVVSAADPAYAGTALAL